MKILYIDCCVSQRGELSRTSQLCSAFLDTAGSFQDVETEHLDLKELKLDPLSAEDLDHRDECFRRGDFEDAIYSLARQFRSADGIVAGAPFWDLSFPSQLRIYIEYISANGVTYRYDENGPHGMCKAKWLVYLTTGGDFERKGSIGVEYWRQLCGMFGAGRFKSIFAGGLDAVPEKADSIIAGACREAAQLANELIAY